MTDRVSDERLREIRALIDGVSSPLWCIDKTNLDFINQSLQIVSDLLALVSSLQEENHQLQTQVPRVETVKDLQVAHGSEASGNVNTELHAEANG